MPELPEVETVARELRSQIIGKQIRSVSVYWDRSFEDHCNMPLVEQKINSIGRKGKYLIVNVDDGCLIIHLRMTGQLLFYAQAPLDEDKHLRFKFIFQDEGELHFVDTRKFGRIYYVSDSDSFLDHVGMDALDSRMSFERFQNILSSSNMNLKSFLLNQKYISGLGNIYVDEALFRTSLHPAAIVSKLSKRKIKILYENIINILNDAINNMGSTISDYRDSYGNSGNNQKFLKVYGRKDEPCLVCDTPIVKIRFAGRGTFLCPKCQQKNRA
jgi:formamidopyrimidine-DNA glycosylase